jgi:N-methylhydantoinase A
VGYRLGVDIGGTFTDAILIDEETGRSTINKVSSTPSDPSVGFLHVTDRILAAAEADPSALRYVAHGTTVATNAIIQRRIAKTALIATEGFSDVLEIGRQIRPSLYDVQFKKPVPLVPRPLTFGIPERLDHHGDVLKPLDEAAVRRVAETLREEGVGSVAVCLLHAYANGAHEERIGEILAEEVPGIAISLSSRVVPEFREYDRASTTVINAGIQPIVQEYLDSIESRLRERGVGGELLVMQSGGGVLTFEGAGERPVFIVESGPAAGVIATSHLARTLGLTDAISFDMGGTTAKVGLVRGGQPQITREYHVGAIAQPGLGSVRGAGYPIRTPVIELAEIGAGGGSIAWVDTGGALRVGPMSAGAEPGPAAYGRGGTEPTVTDANLVLGRLGADSFLGGELHLDVEAAKRAIEHACAGPLGVDVVSAAYGIVEIANAAMASALRLMSVQRGLDPRTFALVGFGGAGPVHANRLASEMGITTTILPPSPGTFSALGLLLNDLRHDYSQTFLRRTATVDTDAMRAIFERMEADGRAMLLREQVPDADIAIEHHVEMQYVGQSYVLAIALPSGTPTAADMATAEQAFHDAHARAYGFSATNEPTQIVNVRLAAIGRIPPWEPRRVAATGPRPEPKQRRPVYFAEAGGFIDCPIYDRAALGHVTSIAGPAIVEEMDSTTVIHPGYRADVDEWGNLVLRPSDAGPAGSREASA